MKRWCVKVVCEEVVCEGGREVVCGWCVKEREVMIL